MTTAKNDVFIGLYHENCYLMGEGGRRGVIDLWEGGDKNLVGESTGEECFQLGRNSPYPHK